MRPPLLPARVKVLAGSRLPPSRPTRARPLLTELLNTTPTSGQSPMPSLRTLFKMASPKGKEIASTLPPDEEPSNLDIIFACSVCNDTVADVYSGNIESVKGLSDGINAKERLVTRLFISSCCHVICIKHINGGNGECLTLTAVALD
jgi:hypothetical protein